LIVLDKFLKLDMVAPPNVIYKLGVSDCELDGVFPQHVLVFRWWRFGGKELDQGLAYSRQIGVAAFGNSDASLIGH
jgi:hypothetical protein